MWWYSVKTKLKDNQEEIAYLLNEFGETDDSKEISLIREYISKVDSRKILKYDTLLEEFDEHVAFKRSAENYPKTDVYPCLDSFSKNVNVHEAFDNLIKYPTSKPVLVDKENMRNFLQLLETNKRWDIFRKKWYISENDNPTNKLFYIYPLSLELLAT